MDAAVKHASRYVRRRKTIDGMYQLSARLSPEDGAVLNQALAAEMEKLRKESDEEVSAADALVAMANDSLTVTAPSGSSAAERFQVNVHIDLDNLLGEDGTISEIDGVGGLHPNTLKRLWCDGSIVSIFERDGEILDMGRKTRTIPPALRRALYNRDKCCRFSGCNQVVFSEAHHIEFWGQGGATKLSNLVRLCSFHHKLVHEAGITINPLANGDFEFKTSDGSTLPRFLRRLKPKARTYGIKPSSRSSRSVQRRPSQTGTATVSTSTRWSTTCSSSAPRKNLCLRRREPVCPAIHQKIRLQGHLKAWKCRHHLRVAASLISPGRR